LAEAEDRRVVVASDPSGRSCVFKLQRSDATRGPDHPLAREYLLLDAMRHPHWVRPVDFGYLDRALAFVAMEYSEGRPLRDRACDGWSNETAELCRQILSGLEVLHTLGYAHLDLHPGQLLLEEARSRQDSPQTTPKVLLLDLGLAAPFSTTLAPRGTPGFIAPEILEGVGSWDRRADLFSFGALLFELLIGEALFRGSSPAAILRAQRDLELALDRLDAHAIPLAVQNVLRALLSTTPARRPGSAAETWHRLRETLPGQSELAVPPRLAVSSDLPFVGREAELVTACTFIEERFAAALSGAVAVTGERGIGKHRFLQRVAAVARTRGWEVAQSDEAGDELVVRNAPRAASSNTQSDIPSDTPSSPPSVTLRAGDSSESSESSESAVESLDKSLAPSPAFEIALPDLDLDLLIGLARARGIETEDLRHRVARWSLGNPLLLAAGLAVLPAQLDSLLSGASVRATERIIRRLEAPREWVEWGRTLQARLAPERLREVILRSILTLVDAGSHAIGREAPIALNGQRHAIETKSAEASSDPLWARAIVDAFPEQSIALASEYLDSEPELAAPTAARVAIVSGSLDRIRARLPNALATLFREGRIGEQLELYASAVCAASDPPALLADAELEVLLAAAIVVLGDAGAGVRAVWAGDPVTGEASVRTGLRAWSRYASRDRRGGLELLSDHRTRRDSSWLFREFLWWRLLFVANGALAFDLEWKRDPVLETSVPLDVWLRLVGTRCEALVSLERHEEARVLLGSCIHLVGEANPAVRIKYWTMTGGIAWAVGRMDEAQVAFTLAVSEATSRDLDELAGPGLGGLGALMFQAGDSAAALTTVRALAWDYISSESLDSATGELVNLAAIQCQMGDLGAADVSLRDAAKLDTPSATNEFSSGILLWRVELAFLEGQYERVISLVDELEASQLRDSGYYLPLAAARQGAARAIRGDEESGAQLVRKALTELEQSDRFDDWAEGSSEWWLTVLLLESASHLPTRAEIDLARTRAVPRVRTVLDLVEGLLLVRAPDASTRDLAMDLLLGAVAALERQQRMSYSWRADAAIAELYLWAGRTRESHRHAQKAKNGLLMIAESLPYEAERESFFESLPVRRFFERLG